VPSHVAAHSTDVAAVPAVFVDSQQSWPPVQSLGLPHPMGTVFAPQLPEHA
jgi:hypothetical protein